MNDFRIKQYGIEFGNITVYLPLIGFCMIRNSVLIYIKNTCISVICILLIYNFLNCVIVGFYINFFLD